MAVTKDEDHYFLNRFDGYRFHPRPAEAAIRYRLQLELAAHRRALPVWRLVVGNRRRASPLQEPARGGSDRAGTGGRPRHRQRLLRLRGLRRRDLGEYRKRLPASASTAGILALAGLKALMNRTDFPLSTRQSVLLPSLRTGRAKSGLACWMAAWYGFETETSSNSPPRLAHPIRVSAPCSWTARGVCGSDRGDGVYCGSTILRRPTRYSPPTPSRAVSRV